MRKKIMILTLAACIGFAGCSGSGSADTAPKSKASTYESNAANYDTEEAAEDAAVSGEAETVTKSVKKKESSEKLVYTGSVTIQTLDYEKSVKSLKKKIADYEGIIQRESQSNDNYDWYKRDNDGQMNRSLSMTVRIPSEDFQKFVDSLSDQGQVMHTSVDVQNISQSYADTSAYVQGLEKEKERLLEMMDKAQTIDEMIKVEDRLTQVETELNQGKTNIATMDKDVALSTVDISMEEVKQYDDIQKPVNFGEKVLKAFRQSFTSFVKFVQELIIVLIMMLPMLLVVLLIVLIIVWISKRRRKKYPYGRPGRIVAGQPASGMPGEQRPAGQPANGMPGEQRPAGQPASGMPGGQRPAGQPASGMPEGQNPQAPEQNGQDNRQE